MANGKHRAGRRSRPCRGGKLAFWLHAGLTVCVLNSQTTLAGTKIPKGPTIWEAAAQGLDSRVALILALDPTLLNARDQQGETALHHAARGCRPFATTFLLSRSADATSSSTSGDTPLHLAIRACPLDLVRALVKAGTNALDARGSAGGTALTIAAADRPEVVGLLLDAGASATVRDAAGVSPAVIARDHAHPEAAEKLTSAVRRALERAFEKAWTERSVDDLRASLEAASGIPGMTGVVWDDSAIKPGFLLRSLQAKRYELVRILFDAAPIGDAELRSQLATRTLFEATAEGDQALVARLAELGVDLRAEKPPGWRVIHEAADNGKTAVLRLLASKGASPGEATSEGRTALHLASGRGHAETVTALLELGAEVNAIDREGRSPLDVARAPAVIADLEAHGGRRTQDDFLFEAARRDGGAKALEGYLRSMPEGAHAAEARQLHEEALYASATSDGTVPALKAFLDTYGDGQHAADVRTRYDDRLFEETSKGSSVAALKGYVETFPEGRHVREVQVRLDDVLYEEKSREGTAAALGAYLEAFPRGRHATAARADAANLERMERMCTRMAELITEHYSKYRVSVSFVRYEAGTVHVRTHTGVQSTLGTFMDILSGSFEQTLRRQEGLSAFRDDVRATYLLLPGVKKVIDNGSELSGDSGRAWKALADLAKTPKSN